MIVDNTRFNRICLDAGLNSHKRENIGTYKEFAQHMVLKRYYSGGEENEEVSYNGYIADVKIGNKIIEIQTSGFSQMKKKLEVFLRDNDVTVVYPIVKNKTVAWIDPDTGEITSKKPSPKHPKPAVFLKELYGIKELIGNGHLSFDIVLLEATEYKLQNGFGKDRKSKAEKVDRFPTGLVDIIHLSTVDDMRRISPIAEGVSFTIADFKKAIGLSAFSSAIALGTLRYLGIAEEAGKNGNCKIFHIKSSASSAKAENC